MRFVETSIAGAFLIETDLIPDNRGAFACAFDEREFTLRGLNTHWKQHNFSQNVRRGTLRGMHFQLPPHEEVKLVWCPRGAIHDVVLDVREASTNRGQWAAFELTADNGRLLYIPAGAAHGFQTLANDTTVSYLVSAHFHPPSARGVRFDDPAFSILWPIRDPILSAKDQGYPRVQF